jgi:hypothetical protein
VVLVLKEDGELVLVLREFAALVPVQREFETLAPVQMEFEELARDRTAALDRWVVSAMATMACSCTWTCKSFLPISDTQSQYP